MRARENNLHEQGSVLTEFALIFFLLLTLILGFVEIEKVFEESVKVDAALRSSARFVASTVSHPDTECSVQARKKFDAIMKQTDSHERYATLSGSSSRGPSGGPILLSLEAQFPVKCSVCNIYFKIFKEEAVMTRTVQLPIEGEFACEDWTE